MRLYGPFKLLFSLFKFSLDYNVLELQLFKVNLEISLRNIPKYDQFPRVKFDGYSTFKTYCVRLRLKIVDIISLVTIVFQAV